MAVVNAIGSILMAIVNGIVAVFDIIIGTFASACEEPQRRIRRISADVSLQDASLAKAVADGDEAEGLGALSSEVEREKHERVDLLISTPVSISSALHTKDMERKDPICRDWNRT